MDEKQRVKLGQNIKAARELRRLSQRRLARNIAVDNSYIGLLERGTRVPSLDTIYALGRALQCSARDLLP